MVLVDDCTNSQNPQMLAESHEAQLHESMSAGRLDSHTMATKDSPTTMHDQSPINETSFLSLSTTPNTSAQPSHTPSPTISHFALTYLIPDPPVFYGSDFRHTKNDISFSEWYVKMNGKLASMAPLDEQTKVNYIVSRVTSEAFYDLLDEDHRRGGFRTAREMLNYLMEQWDADVRKVDMRFGRG
ncbi:hypothetical protein LTR05_006647 [Lithohypha guttulata]|uniref:Uncharacterized protein n=1 Tax=Lithohypha guttulata TaxID=1690604 RepID=A0AAN7SVK6_9EURO|nr:hypothetical protein LTR05_006647 [Lithohypha guttulata]